MSSAAPALLIDRPRLITKGSLVVAVSDGRPYPDPATLRRVRDTILQLVGLSKENVVRLTPNELAARPNRVLFQADGAAHVTLDQADGACSVASQIVEGSEPCRRRVRRRKKTGYKNRRYHIAKQASGTNH